MKQDKRPRNPLSKLHFNDSNSMDSLLKYATKLLNVEKSIYVTFLEGLYHHSSFIYLNDEDIRQVANLNELGASHIGILMRLVIS